MIEQITEAASSQGLSALWWLSGVLIANQGPQILMECKAIAGESPNPGFLFVMVPWQRTVVLPCFANTNPQCCVWECSILPQDR